MKKLLSILLLASAIIFTSCKEKHTIRFTNNYNESINNARAGNAFFGTVNAGSTSAYHAIDAGNFDITGTSASGQVLKGTGTVSGKGKHEWTLILSSAGQLSIKNEK
jgi:hypothetical protein